MANNKQVKIGIGFDVDKNGLKELENIQNQLINIASWGNQAKGTDEFTKGLKEAGQTASKLYDILEKSYSANLGTVNVTKFKQELDKAGISVKTMKQDLAKAGAQGNAAFASLGSALLNTNVQLKKSNSLLDEMATTMANTVKWGVTSSIFNNISSSVQDAYHYVKQLDSSLNDIRIVTDKSAESMAKFAVQANTAAKNLGASTRDYTDASLIYYQQGLSDKEAAARAETTLKAANVTGQNTAEVSEQLTAVWNGYKVSAQEAELYVDKLAAVAATTASDLEELSTGMSKVASAASLMGVDIDQLNAQLATIVSVTREAPESIGTALKTVYARMSDIKSGLDGETTLDEYTQQMADMGVHVLDANGNLRDMGDVVEEIGGKWSSMTREQQTSLAQTIAGTRQYSRMMALFDNWDMYTDALNTSAKAAGTLQHQQDIYMETTEAHLQQLKTSAEDVYDTLIKTEEINVIIDIFKNGTDVLGSFFDAFGGGVKSMAAGAIILSSVFSKQIGEGLINFQKNKYREQSNLDVVNMKKELIQKKIDETGNETIEESAAIAKYKAEADCAEKILKLKNGITNEDYEQLTSIQAKIGALTEEAELHKKIAEEKKKEFKEQYDEEFDFNDIDGRTHALIEELKNKKITLQNLQNDSDVPSGITEELEQEIAILKEKIALLQQIQEENNAAQSAERQRSAQETDFDVMRENAQKAAELNNSITAVTSSMTALFSVWGAINSLGSIWNNEDLSTGEKLVQTFITLGAVLPMVTMAMKKFKDAMGDTTGFGASFDKVWGTLIKKLTGASAAAGGAAGTTGAVTGLGATLSSLGATLSSLAAVVLPVIAVVGALTAAFIAVYNEATKYERAAKKASETHENIKASAEEAKTKVENLKNAFKEYDTVTDTLNQCVKGTNEWNEALEKANNQVLTMLNQFPELLEMEGAITRNAEGLLEISKSAEAQIKADTEKRKETLEAAALLSGVDVTKTQNEYDASSIIKENSVSVVAEDWAQASAAGILIPGASAVTQTASIVENFSFYDEASSILLNDIDKLTGLTETELESQLRESLGGLKETYNISDLAFDNMIESLRGAQEEIEKLGQNASKADIALENIGNTLAAENLQGYSDAVQEIASESFEKNYSDIKDEVIGIGKDKISALSQEATDKDLRDLWARYNAAMDGANFSLAQNEVQGTKNNRTFHYKDKEGKEQSVTLEQMASTIATSEALQKMGASAAEAAKALKNLQTEVGNTDIYEGLENFIATKGSFGSMNRREFEQLQNSVNEAGGVEDYLNSIGIKDDETAKQYGFEDIDSLISAFESGIKNMDFDGLADEMYKPVQDAYKQQMNNISTLSFDAQASLIDSMNQAYEVAGQEGLNSFANIFNKMEASGEAEEFATALNSIDWSTANVENVEKALKDAGVETAFTVDEIRSLISSMDSTGTSVSELNEAFATMKNILDGLATGGNIAKEEFDKIGSTLGEEFQGYFTPMLDGTYKLIGAAEDFKEAVNQSLLDSALESKGQLGEKINRDQAFINRGWEDLSKTRTLSSDGGYVQDQAGVSAQLDFLKEYGSDASLPTRTWRIGLEEGSLTQEDLGAIAEAVAACEGAYGNLENELATTQEQFNQLDMSIALSKTNLEDLKTSLENQEISQDSYNVAALQMAEEEKWEGLDATEVEEYADHLQEAAEKSELLSEELTKNEEAAEDVAAYTKKMNRGIESLAKGYEEWSDILKKSDEGSEEYADAMKDMKKSMSDVLGVQEDFLSDDFILKNMEDIERAAKGDADAIDRLAIAAGQDILMNIDLADEGVREELLNLHNSLATEIPDIKVGATLDDGDFINKANEIVSAAGMTVDEANAYFRSLGFEPEFVVTNETRTAPMYGTKTYTTGIEMGTVKYGEDSEYPYIAEMTTRQEQVYMGDHKQNFVVPALSTDGKTPKVKSLTRTNSGSMNNKSSSNPGGGKKGGGSKGGGSKKKDVSKLDRFKDEIDIYHEINTQLAILQKNYDKLAKAQERLTGKALIENLKEQTKVINDQIAATKEKAKIAQKELTDEKANLRKLSGKGAKSDLYSGKTEVKYNKDGSIKNYDEVLQSEQNAINKMVAKYNADVAKYKKKGGATEEQQKDLDAQKKKIDAAQKTYEELKSKMENYDTLVSETIPELNAQMRELYDKKIENQIETFDLKLQLRLETSQAERDFNDFLKEINEEDDAGLVQDMGYNESNLKTYQSDIEKTKNQLNEALTAYNTIKNGGTDATFGDNAAAALEKVKEYQELLTEQLIDYKDVQREVQDQYEDLVDSMQEQFDAQFEAYERIDDQLEHLLNLQSKLYGEEAYDDMNKIIAAQQINNKAQIDAKKKEIDALKQARDVYAQGSKEWEQHNAQVQEAQAELNDLTETGIDLALTKYENTINRILNDAEKRVAGMSFDSANEDWESFQTYDNHFLDKLNKAIKTNEFISNVQSKINETNSIRTQKILNDLKDQELKKLQEKDRLTQYDVDRANKMLDITLKQIALEEAQNNKSKMRLRRDSQGNYSYQYVADEDQMAKAKEELDKANADLYNLDRDKYLTALKDYNSEYQAMMDKMDETMKSAEYRNADKKTQEEMLNNIYTSYEPTLSGLEQDVITREVNLKTSASNLAISQGTMSEEEWNQKTEEEKRIWLQDFAGIRNTAYQAVVDVIHGEGGVSAQIKKMLEESSSAARDFQKTADETLGTTGEKTKAWSEDIANNLNLLTGEDGAITKVNKSFQDIVTTFIGEDGKGGLIKAAGDTLKSVNDLSTGFTDMESNAIKAAEAAKKAIQANNDEGADAADEENKKFTSEGSEPPEEQKPEPANTQDNQKAEVGDEVKIKGKKGKTKQTYKKKNLKTKKEKLKVGDSYLISEVNGETSVKLKTTKGTNKGWIKLSDIKGYNTGGYTGRWNSSEGRLAFLHQKELVLNAKDTENMLRMTKITRQMMRDMNPELLQRQYEEMTNSLKVANNKEWKIAKNQMLNELQALSTFKEEMAKKIVDMEATNYSFAEITQSIMNKMQEDIMAKYNFTIDKIKNQVAEFKHSQKEKDVIDQKVHIEATFPNVSHSREIEDAFNNLINIAAQRAYNTKRLK